LRVRFHELARAELEWAIGYCELELRGRGRRLLRDFEDVVDWARTFPHSGSPIRHLDTTLEVRGFLLGRFTYTVISAVRADEIVIVAVAHHSLEPNYWKDRLQEV
jgi:plasmid stabilization system protein ParE